MSLNEILDAPITTHLCRCHYRCICNRAKGAKEAYIECVCSSSSGCKCPPKFDVRLAELKKRTHESIELRVKGAIVQRVSVDKRQISAHVREIKREGDIAASATPPTLEAVEAELEKLRAGEGKSQESDMIEAETKPTNE